METDDAWDSSAFDKSLSRLANAKQSFRNKNSDYKGVLGRAKDRVFSVLSSVRNEEEAIHLLQE